MFPAVPNDRRQIGADLAHLRAELERLTSVATLSAAASTAERVEVLKVEQTAAVGSLREVSGW